MSIDIKLFDLLSPGNPTYFFQTVDSPDELPEALSKIVAISKTMSEREFASRRSPRKVTNGLIPELF